MRKHKAAGAWKTAGILSAGLGAICVVGSGLDAQAQAGQDTLQAYRNKNRVLLVFAPNNHDAQYRRQTVLLDGKDAGLNERDIIRFYVFAHTEGSYDTAHMMGRSNEASVRRDFAALRRRFTVTPTQFKVALIGKDGHTAYTSGRPLSSEQLFGLIDAMPMRREEMRQRANKTGGRDAADISPDAHTADAKTDAKTKPNAVHNKPNKNLPNKNMTPAQVVRTQMEALQHNDTPHADAGIETTFAFASPENKLATGPLEHFIGIVKAPAYLPMLNCKSVTYDPIVIDGDTAKQRVHIVGADGTRGVYVFLLSRQTDGPFAGCWMNDGCIREEPEPARDTSNDA